ncbi:hypothetical protein Pph01_70140 [Planotetraspora phitsanulokensis]|uniref:Uncharacterized protein n=1 Tax=Planotetraspora phitsanulokensis TaxID=575192 RepID=A0A8J3UCJ8_9ACTN|nr:hypothetical protein Pph01_70140 [Planotetraspora phitsanulokensis]
MPFAAVIAPFTTLNCEAGAALAAPDSPATAAAAPATTARIADLVFLKRIVDSSMHVTSAAGHLDAKQDQKRHMKDLKHIRDTPAVLHISPASRFGSAVRAAPVTGSKGST